MSAQRGAQAESTGPAHGSAVGRAPSPGWGPVNAGRGGLRFTLVEMIAALVLIGLGAAVAATAFASLSHGFVRAQSSVELGQKAQLAVTRMTKEFTFVKHDASGPIIAVTGNRSVTYTSRRDDAAHTLAWSGVTGAPLTLDGATLAGGVASFQVTYDTVNRAIDLQLTLSAAQAITHRLVLYP